MLFSLKNKTTDDIFVKPLFTILWALFTANMVMWHLSQGRCEGNVISRPFFVDKRLLFHFFCIALVLDIHFVFFLLITDILVSDSVEWLFLMVKPTPLKIMTKIFELTTHFNIASDKSKCSLFSKGRLSAIKIFISFTLTKRNHAFYFS